MNTDLTDLHNDCHVMTLQRSAKIHATAENKIHTFERARTASVAKTFILKIFGSASFSVGSLRPTTSKRFNEAYKEQSQPSMKNTITRARQFTAYADQATTKTLQLSEFYDHLKGMRIIVAENMSFFDEDAPGTRFIMHTPEINNLVQKLLDIFERDAELAITTL